ncbi:MAG TPA: hypothetical protein VKD90_12175 [Gemmataceae bacterium]|nr:hypothetical protein [Gemmataceae bacterium]
MPWRCRSIAFARPGLEPLEDRLVLTPFTVTSPTARGLLPAGVTPVGGIVLDLIGVNGRRVVSQLPASMLFVGRFDSGTPAEFRGNPGTIGIQTGFTRALLAALGGGIAEMSVRLTVDDGDSAPGDFDFGDTTLLLNGIPVGDFSRVPTEETTPDGQTALSANPAGGFRNDTLDTGFFHVTDRAVLADLFIALLRRGSVTVQMLDVDPFENVFDFTRGVSGDLIDVGQPPSADRPRPSAPAPAAAAIVPIPPPPGPEPILVPRLPVVIVQSPPPLLVLNQPPVPLIEGAGPLLPSRFVPMAGTESVEVAKPPVGAGVEIGAAMIGQGLAKQAAMAARGLTVAASAVLDRLTIDMRPLADRLTWGAAPAPAPPAPAPAMDSPPTQVAESRPRREGGGAVQTGLLVLAALMVTRWRNDRRPARERRTGLDRRA